MYQLGKHLVNPYFLLVVALGVILACLWYRRREGKWMLWALTAVYAGLVALGTPVAAHFAIRSLEGMYPELEQRPPETSAIVVLSGGERTSFYRCLRAAQLYRQGRPCLVVCSCEPDRQDTSESQTMRNYLVWLGVNERDVVLEANSHNTYENAVNCSRLLEARQVHTIVLVTDGAHLPRACAAFRKQGSNVVPAGLNAEPAAWSPSILEFLPNTEAVHKSGYAAEEWLGMAWYWAKGRI